ncbi:putative non-specific lipid-transfer protein-like protein [Iris pallida]|uniref:Non-specific lipid-transfer protein-like protein n=1 Tax=Iris pallida TaxID=29817 RepID=A0AAX6HZT2_IRIPA|nr:putative non-specific lipid-transfer protein-like protein [Iris pallida]KAJ6845725.1 putative non-specific lipid-transfer protein-like protein [Iris pallida]
MGVVAKKSSSGCAHLLHLFLLLSVAMMVVNTDIVHVDAAKGMVGTNAPTAAAPEADCSSALVSLAGCLTFVEDGSKEAKPQRECCSSLKEVVKKEVGCLCQAFKQSADLGVKLNITKALALPSACGVKTPPFSKCNLALGDGAPAAPAPAFSPVEPPILSPSSQQSTVKAPAPSLVHSVAASFSAPSLASLLASVAALSLYYL